MSDAGEMRKTLKKLGLVDKHAIESSLEIAALALLPDEYSQRDIFRALMPKLHLMRKRGFSFRQIATLLEQAGLKLAIGTVRTYYYEFLMEMLEECENYSEKSSKAVNNVTAGDSSKRGAAPSAVDESKAVHTALKSQVDDAARQKSNSTVSRFVSTVGGASMAPPTAGPQAAQAQPAAVRSPAPAGRIVTPPTKPQPPLAGAQPGPLDAAPAGTASASSLSHPEAEKSPTPALVAHGLAGASARCTTEPTPDQIEEKGGLPEDVYDFEQVLEHPAIAGLWLSRNQRLFKARLEYVKADGSSAFETGKEMLARRDWRKPIQSSQGRTSKDFVEMNTSILGKPKAN